MTKGRAGKTPDYVTRDNDGLVVMEKGGKGVFNSEGEMIVPCEYKYIHFYNKHKLIVADRTSYVDGVVVNGQDVYNYNGEKILEEGCQDIDIYDGGYMVVMRMEETEDNYRQSYGLYDASGNEIIPVEYKSMGDVGEGLVLAVERGTDEDVIFNLDGDVVVKGLHVTGKFSGGLAVVRGKGGSGIMNRNLEATYDFE